MKRIGNLFENVCSIDNLYLAYTKARQGKVNTYGVKLFEMDLDKNIVGIRKELITGVYRTSKYSVFTVYEPKERLVYRLPFKDRVVHHAITVPFDNNRLHASFYASVRV